MVTTILNKENNMSSKIILKSVLDNALRKLQVTGPVKFSYKVTSFEGKPFVVRMTAKNTNKVGSPVCFIHNITVGLMEYCGDGIEHILGAVVAQWVIRKDLGKVNLTQLVLDTRFHNQAANSMPTLSTEERDMVSLAAQRVMDLNSKQDIRLMDAYVLPTLFTEDMFVDADWVKSIIDSGITSGNSVPRLVQSLAPKVMFDTVAGRSASLKAIAGGKCEAEVSEIADELSVPAAAIVLTAKLAAFIGTPRFIMQYAARKEEILRQYTERADNSMFESLAADISSNMGTPQFT